MTESSKKKVEKLVNELMKYQDFLEAQSSNPQFKHIMQFKEFLISSKAKQLVTNLIVDFRIDLLVVESSAQKILTESNLLLEWERYKKIPQTNLTYRYDKGDGRPGFEDNIHVFLGNTKNQVYAINKSGTPHDGSRAKLGSKEMKFLKSIGFTPPPNGILEWKSLSPDVEYTGYKLYLIFD